MGCGSRSGSEYSDDWVRGMARIKLVEKPQEIFDIQSLDIVPNGKTKRIRDILSQLNLDHRKISLIGHYRRNMVGFYEWRLSDSYKLSIMTGISETQVDGNDNVLDLDGYGVRIIRIFEIQ